MSYLGKRSRYSRPMGSMPYPKRRRAANMGTVTATRGFRAYYGARRKKTGVYGAKTQVELKVSDLDVADYDVNTTGSFTLLHIPTLGSDYTNRIGRKTVIKSVYIRGRIAINEAVSISAGVVVPAQQARMILFLDKQPNGTAPTVTQLLKTASPASMLNLDNRDRFSVIKDKTYVFDPMDTGSEQGVGLMNHTVSSLKCYKKMNTEVIFNGTNGGSIADINSNALYMFWIGEHAGGMAVTAHLSTRVRFDDQ